MLDILQPFSVSLIVGLLIGTERERSHPEGSGAMGVRTFSLIALLGAISAWMKDPALTIGLSAFVLILTLAGYLRSSDPKKADPDADIGLTTEVSAALVFGISHVAFRDLLLAALLGIVTLVILYSRRRLHAFARETLKPKEIKAAVSLLVFLVVFVPFLPDRTLDIWGLFNPRRLALLIGIIAGIQFLGYAVERMLGSRMGTMVAGFFGGMVSSTAVFVTLPKRVLEHPESLRPVVAGALLATVATTLQFIAVVVIASPELIIPVSVMAGAIVLTGTILAYFIDRSSTSDLKHSLPDNPLDVIGVLKLSMFVAIMLISVGVVRNMVGDRALGLVNFIGGLFELQAVSLATASLHGSGKLASNHAMFALAMALLASFVSKFAISWTIGRGKFALYMTPCLLLMIVVGTAGYFFGLTLGS
jgi:uncharacterized membrane protein (DUF4010 family)